MKIELNDLLSASLNSGVNLFLGAGFSLLAKDQSGVTLPLGTDLQGELAQKFNLPVGLNLPKMSTVLESTRKDDFINFLRNRFSVDEYYDRYNSLLKINIKSIFTTNIDDLIFKIYENSHRFYINDIIEYGPAFNDKVAIDYVPLHGCILHTNRKLVFSTVDIASAFNNEQNVWHYLRLKATQNPTIFWGYSLEDSGVIEALFAQPEKNKELKPKWIILHKEDETTISYFKTLGFNIIIGNTAEMLDWIEDNVPEYINRSFNLINNTSEVFFGLNIPNKSSKLPVRPLKYFYMGDTPLWSDIFNNRIPKTRHYENLLNLLYSKDKKNIILTGIPASGKTTLMMQVAAVFDFHGHKLLFSDINIAKANLIYDRLMGEPAMIFLDNFTDDIEVFNYFSNKTNIRVVGADREYNLEIIFHKINNKNTEIYNCTDLQLLDVQTIYNNIPNEVRHNKLRNKTNEKKDLSMFEFVNLNILGPTINSRFKGVIDQLDETNQIALDLLIMICYVNKCRSAVSFDMIDMFLGDEIESYEEIFKLTRTLGGLITDYNDEFKYENQDYYAPRSLIIADKIIDVTPNEIFRDVFTRFHRNVPHYSINRFYVFKKYAYDSSYAKKSFPNWKEGLEFYENIIEYDSSPFIYQQAALFLLSKKRYSDAFNWIDKALLKSGKYVFSIKNTHAVILFEANINSEDYLQSRRFLDESMEILESCYKADLRKLYHSITFAKNSLRYYSVFGDNIALSYLQKANKWLTEEKNNNPWNISVRNLLSEISLVIKN